MLIAISGVPGSGKTTVAKLVAARLGLEHVYAGDIFRRQAETRGLSLAEYLRLAENDSRIDRALDDHMRERARRGDAVLEGRLSALMCDQAHATALRVFLDCSEAVCAERIARREGGATAARLAEIQHREASDRRRYQEIYGVDYHDRTRYDVVISTDTRTPEDLADEIVERASAHERA